MPYKKEIEKKVEQIFKEINQLVLTIQEESDYAKSIIETVRDPLLILDGDLKIISASRSFYQTFKASAAEIEGQLLYNLHNKQWDIPELRDFLEKILPQNTSFDNFEVEHDFETIGKRYMLLNARRIYKEAEKTQLILLAMEDITERKMAEQALKESEKWLSITLRSIGDAVIATNKKGIIIFMNHVAQVLTGWSQEDAVGKPLKNVFNIINEETGEPAENPVERVIREGIVVGLANHTVLIAKNGLKIPIDDSAAPIKDEEGNIFGIILIFKDITERKNSERALLESEKKYREAYNQSEFYKDLLSHDIVNILQILTLSSEIGMSNLNDKTKLEKIFTRIIEQTKRADNLINNVYKISKLEDGRSSINIMEICEILKKSINFIKESFSKKQIKIQVHAPESKIYVKGNEFLQDIFDNILHNAIKYNKSQIPEVFIKFSKKQKDDINFLGLHFIDNGIGIPDENKDAIFQRYFRDTKDISGMGLGLSFVKKIVNSYNGEILVRDRVQGDYSKGSEFVVLIPEAEKNF
ncbi:MAG: PAS domain S-box protein [Candidatus Helarchaeota archaeon]